MKQAAAAWAWAWATLGVLGPGGAQADTLAVQRGEQVYARCLACHALETDRVGPRHCGLFGRKAGSLASAEYSQAMKRSGLVWNARTLERFLAAPMRVVPGTSMTYDGIASRQERSDLIAYLAQATRGPACAAPDTSRQNQQTTHPTDGPQAHPKTPPL